MNKFIFVCATAILVGPVYAAKPVPVEVPFDDLVVSVISVFETNNGNKGISDQ